jgi:hypothetical protein
MPEALNYRYGTLTDQLDAGMRSLELDLNRDPEGGRFVHPAAYEAAKAKGIPESLLPMTRPGSTDRGSRSCISSISMCVPVAISSPLVWRSCAAGRTLTRPRANLHPAGSQERSHPDLPRIEAPLPFTAQSFDELDADLFRVIGATGSSPPIRCAVPIPRWRPG